MGLRDCVVSESPPHPGTGERGGRPHVKRRAPATRVGASPGGGVADLGPVRESGGGSVRQQAKQLLYPVVFHGSAGQSALGGGCVCTRAMAKKAVLHLSTAAPHSPSPGEGETRTSVSHPSGPRPPRGAVVRGGDTDDGGPALELSSLKALSLKTALLLALTSAKRVSELTALSVHPSCLWIRGDRSGATLRPNPSFVPKSLRSSFRSRAIQLGGFSLPPHIGDREAKLHLLCQACYVERTAAIRRTEQLFVCFGGGCGR